MGLPSQILNEAKLLPFHFPNSEYRIICSYIPYIMDTSGYQNLQEMVLQKTRAPLPRNLLGKDVSGGRRTTPQSTESIDPGPTKSNVTIGYGNSSTVGG